MKISKKSYGLAAIPLVGVISLVGTSPAFAAAECSTLSPCISNSVSAAVSLPSDALDSVTVEVTAPPVAPVTQTLDGVKDTVDTVTTPIAELVNKTTAPIVDSVPVPVAPIIPPETVSPPSTSLDESAAVEPVTSAPEGTRAEIVTPADTKSAVIPVAAEIHNSSADSNGLTGLMMLTPNVIDFQPAAIHSSQGTQTKIMNSGAFGFGHVNPVDDPVGFAGLAFAYIIVLGSAISLAVKRGFVLNFRGLISRI